MKTFQVFLGSESFLIETGCSFSGMGTGAVGQPLNAAFADVFEKNVRWSMAFSLKVAVVRTKQDTRHQLPSLHLSAKYELRSLL